LFGLLPVGPFMETAAEPDTDRVPARRGFAVVAVLLIVAALIGIRNQSRRFVESEAAQIAALPQPPAAASAQPEPVALPRLTRIGPFAVGQPLTQGWSVVALEFSDGGFIAEVAGRPGRARFEVTCALSKNQSPFDLGAAHIFYGNNLEFHDLEEAGWALQAEVHKAADGGDVCDSVRNWRTLAGG